MINFLKKIKTIMYLSKRFAKPAVSSWLNMKGPFSKVFGFDRGTPIDRKFIDNFLSQNSHYIKNDILEIGDDQYISKYGKEIKRAVVLAGNGKRKETISFEGDLTKKNTLLKLGKFDCVIATNVLNFIFDYDSAVYGLSILTKEKTGCVLATVAGGPTQVSRYDYVKWGDYWRFTDLSVKKIFEKYFEKVNIETYGNAPMAAAFNMGLAQEEIPSQLFQINDFNYQIIISIKASLPKTH